MNDTSAETLPSYPWHTALWNRFVRWEAEDRLAHALLIAGPEGLGGLALAKRMARFLLCRAPKDGESCGQCRGCMLTRVGSHPDLLLVQPEDGARLIKIQQVRDVSSFVGKTAQQGGRKLVVLEPAENLNPNAANALLKSLEEPAGPTHFLLVCYEPGQLMATIRSRCAKLPLTTPPAKEAIEWLQQVGVKAPHQLLSDAGGQPLKVQRWVEQDFPAQQARMEKDLSDVMAGRQSPLAVAKSWLDFDTLSVIDCLLVWVQAAIRASQAGTEDPHQVSRVLVPVPGRHLFLFREKLLFSKGELLGPSNPNLELLLDNLLLDWSALTRSGG